MPARISLKASSETILDGACAYHETAIETDPEAAFLLKNFRDVLDRLIKANDIERLSRRTVMKGRAKLAFADAAMDRAVAAFDMTLLGAVSKDRKSPLYRKYFPEMGITPVVTAPIETELRLVGTIVSQLQEAKKGSPETTNLKILKDAHDGLKAAHDGVKAALQEHANAYAVELEARMGVARQLEIDEAELMKKFGKGRRLNSFFLPREEAEEETAPAATPAAPAGA
jgi:hypothetical protein